MVADQRLVNVVVSKQVHRMTRVLACDLVVRLQDAQRRKRDVLEIAEGRADKIKAAARCRIRGICRLGRGSLRSHVHESSTRSGHATRARTQEQCYDWSFECHM